MIPDIDNDTDLVRVIQEIRERLNSGSKTLFKAEFGQMINDFIEDKKVRDTKLPVQDIDPAQCTTGNLQDAASE